MYGHINYIGKRFKNRNCFQKGKGALVELVWFEVAEKFREVAVTRNDAQLRNLS